MVIANIGERLREARKRSGLTQTEVSEATGIGQTTISNYEKGVSEPPINSYLLLMNLYNGDDFTALNDLNDDFLTAEMIKVFKPLPDWIKKAVITLCKNLTP